MTPVCRCLSRVDHASAITDSTVVEQIGSALDELEHAYHRPSERIVALEEVLQHVAHNRNVAGMPFGRFVRISVERRQLKLSRQFG